MLMSHVRLNPMIIMPNSHSDTSKYVETVTISQRPNQHGNDPNVTFDPLRMRSHVWPPEDHCTQVPWKYVMLKYVDTATIFQNSD